MYERFTDRARKVMQLANQEAQRLNHDCINPEHILLGLCKEGSGVAANVLKNLDIDLYDVRREINMTVTLGMAIATMGKLPQTPLAKKVVSGAISAAQRIGANYVGSEHLLIGLLAVDEGISFRVLSSFGLTAEVVEAEIALLLGSNISGQAKTDGKWSIMWNGGEVSVDAPTVTVSEDNIVYFPASSCISVNNTVAVDKEPEWMTHKEAREVVATAWCLPGTSGKVFDCTLADAFAAVMVKEVNSRLARHELTLSVEKISPQAGDVVVVTMPEGATYEEQVVSAMAGIGLPCQFIVAPHGYQVSNLDENAMRDAGWVRRQDDIVAKWDNPTRDIKADMAAATKAVIDIANAVVESKQESKPYVGLNEVEALPRKPVEPKKNPFFSDDWRSR